MSEDLVSAGRDWCEFLRAHGSDHRADVRALVAQLQQVLAGAEQGSALNALVAVTSGLLGMMQAPVVAHVGYQLALGEVLTLTLNEKASEGRPN